MWKILKHPVTQFNLIIVGFLIVVQGLHTYAHYQMDRDVDSYVHNFLRKNPDFKTRWSWQSVTIRYI